MTSLIKPVPLVFIITELASHFLTSLCISPLLFPGRTQIFNEALNPGSSHLRHYGREIAAYDIQTRRCDVYGQELGYEERVMLLYDGLHYDAMALAGTTSVPSVINE